MKLSEVTKKEAEMYVECLKTTVEQELGFGLPRKVFFPLRQSYEHHLHEVERASRLGKLQLEAAELGYRLVKASDRVAPCR